MISIFRHKQRKDDEEFDELFRSSYQSLYHHAYSLLHNAEDSRDIVSEVFVKILETKDTGTVNTGYLMAMVHNKALDILRSRKVEDEARQMMLLDYQTFMDPDRHKEELLKDILHFVETELTPQARRILRMCYNNKKSYKQVAEELNISIQAVNKHISQALRKLREKFNPQQE